MRALRSVLILNVVCLIQSSLLAQQLPQRDPQALAILARSYAVMGGPNWALVRGTQETIQVTEWEGDVSTTNTVTITTRGLTDVREEAQGASGFVLVTSGARARAAGAGQPPLDLPRISLGNAGITQIPALSVLSLWSDPKAIVKYLGTETAGNSTLYHISVQVPLDSTLGLGEYDFPCHIFIDSQTFLATRLDITARSPNNLRMAYTKTVTYGDYRPVQGLLFPFRVTYNVRGHVLKSYQVSAVALNVPVTDSTFDPAGVR